MNLCDAFITKVHWIKKTMGENVPDCAKWECKFTYNCYGAIDTRIVYAYSLEELRDKYYEGKMILV